MTETIIAVDKVMENVASYMCLGEQAIGWRDETFHCSNKEKKDIGMRIICYDEFYNYIVIFSPAIFGIKYLLCIKTYGFCT